MDLLPSAVTQPFADSLVQRLNADELSRAFRAVVRALLEQIRSVDEDLALRLQETVTMLSDTEHPNSR
jgi:hypothetical protein